MLLRSDKIKILCFILGKTLHFRRKWQRNKTVTSSAVVSNRNIYKAKISRIYDVCKTPFVLCMFE